MWSDNPCICAVLLLRGNSFGMADGTVVVEVDAKTGNATKEVEKLTEAIDEVRDSVEDLGDQMDEGFRETGEAVAEVSEKVEQISVDFSLFGDRALDMVDSVVPGFVDLKDGVQDFSGGLKGMKSALISTGLGALVALLGALVNWFMESEKGTKILKIATEALGMAFKHFQDNVINPLAEGLIGLFTNPKDAVMGFYDTVKSFVIDQFEYLMETLGLVGDAFKKLFEGDFSGAAESAGKAFIRLNNQINPVVIATRAAVAVGTKLVEVYEEMAEATVQAVEKAKQLVEMRSSLKKLNEEVALSEERLTAEADKQRDIADNELKTYDERAKALAAAYAAEKRLLAQKKETAELDAKIARMELAAATTDDARSEAKGRLADAILEQTALEGEAAQLARDYANDSYDLDQEELERKRDIAEMVRDARLSAAKDEIEAQREVQREELRIDEQDALRELTLLQATEEEKQALRNYYAQQRANLETEFAKEDKEIREEREATMRDLDAQLVQDSIQAQLQQRMKELALEEKQHLEDLQKLGANEEELQAVRERYQGIRAKTQAEADAALQEQQINAAVEYGTALLDIIDTLGNAQEAETERDARKQFKRNQALQKGQAIMNTASAVTAQLAVPQDALTGANFAKAAFAAAQGAAQVIAISRQKFDGGGFDADVNEPGGFGRGGSEGFQVQGFDLSFLQQQAEQAGGIRAYVVNQEIQDADALAQALEDKARL